MSRGPCNCIQEGISVLPSHAKPISVDDHLIEPKTLWSSRLPAGMRDRGPKVISVEGKDYWEYAGSRVEINGLHAVAGKDREDFSPEAVSFDQMRPGCYDPVERLRDMDEDGVWGSLCFPEYSRFAGHRFLEGNDRDLALECVRAYNDFLFEEWCATDPDRLIPLVILPLWDPALAAAEVRRTADLGARAIAFSENPTHLGLPSWFGDHWDPVFAAAEDAELPICMHIGSSGQIVRYSDDAPYAVHVSLTGTNSMIAASALVLSPVFQKFPKLKVVLSEGEAGWAPHLMERLDYTWERHRFHSELREDVKPSDLFREHLYLCIISDEHALANREHIGVENLLWESDYPHSDSTWPNSRKVLEESMQNVPDEHALQISELNARSLFRVS